MGRELCLDVPGFAPKTLTGRKQQFDQLKEFLWNISRNFETAFAGAFAESWLERVGTCILPKLHFPQRKSFWMEAQVIPRSSTRQVRLHRSQEGKEIISGTYKEAVRFIAESVFIRQFVFDSAQFLEYIS